MGSKSTDGTKAYVTLLGILTFLGGTIFGVALVCIIVLMARRFKARGNQESSNKATTTSQGYNNVVASAGNDSIYQEVDLSKMKTELDNNYQSMQENTRSRGVGENETGYAELSIIRGNEENSYQALSRV